MNISDLRQDSGLGQRPHQRSGRTTHFNPRILPHWWIRTTYRSSAEYTKVLVKHYSHWGPFFWLWVCFAVSGVL